jgi:hypothetical protein
MISSFVVGCFVMMFASSGETMNSWVSCRHELKMKKLQNAHELELKKLEWIEK